MKKILKDFYRLLSPAWQNAFLDYKVDLNPRYGHGKAPHNTLYNIIDKERQAYAQMLAHVLKHKESLWQIKDAAAETDKSKPVWNNDFLPGLDIAMLYTMIAELKPRKYVEIGSGNSTKVAYKAKTETHPNMEIISIDPMPRAEIDSLANQIIRKPFEQCDFSFLFDLTENDILFVDNSHRILPNSDATVFFMEVLPNLKKGVVVQIHDIYLPYDYPDFMCERLYSEQYGLAAFILANPQKYKVFMPNYFVSEDKNLSEILSQLWQHPSMLNIEKHGGSFWLQIQ